MGGVITRYPAKLIAVLAIVFQAILPGAFAAAYPDRAGLAGVFCLQSGERTLAATQAMNALADLFANEEEPGDGAQTDCPLCVMAHSAAPPAPAPAIDAPRPAAADKIRGPFYHIGFARQAQGPPLGLRAPPFFS